MKALKKFLSVGLAVAATASFNNVTAQTFSNNESSVSEITPRQQLVINLLKKEIDDNKEFREYKDAINYYLDLATNTDAFAPNCFKYTPLLVEAVNSNAKFSMLYNLQKTFEYIFNNNNGTQTTYKFIGDYNNDGKFELWPSITITSNNTTRELGDQESFNYIVNNYCNPLNKILDQNENLPIPEILNILHQKFSH